MEFLKIISNDANIEIIPLNKISSIKVVMGELYINGENKYIKVENYEEFLNKYITFAAASHVVMNCGSTPDQKEAILRYICIKNINRYAKIFVDKIKL